MQDGGVTNTMMPHARTVGSSKEDTAIFAAVRLRFFFPLAAARSCSVEWIVFFVFD